MFPKSNPFTLTVQEYQNKSDYNHFLGGLASISQHFPTILGPRFQNSKVLSSECGFV
jgi:hypothetical protein